MISGIGSGMTIRFGGAIDGIDVLSVIFAKKLGLSIGSFVMIFNTILYIICGILIHSWILPLYSIITYFIVNHFQINKLKKLVHSIDSTAFISLHDVSDIIKKQESEH